MQMELVYKAFEINRTGRVTTNLDILSRRFNEVGLKTCSQDTMHAEVVYRYLCRFTRGSSQRCAGRRS